MDRLLTYREIAQALEDLRRDALERRAARDLLAMVAAGDFGGDPA